VIDKFPPQTLWRHKNGKHYLLEKVATFKATSTSPYAALDGEKVVRYLSSDSGSYDRLASEFEASFTRVELFHLFREFLSEDGGVTKMLDFVGSLLEEGWKHNDLYSIINNEVLGNKHRDVLTEQEYDHICDQVLEPLSGWGSWPDTWPADKKWVRSASWPDVTPMKRKGK
jgi:hypothetical protein